MARRIDGTCNHALTIAPLLLADYFRCFRRRGHVKEGRAGLCEHRKPGPREEVARASRTVAPGFRIAAPNAMTVSCSLVKQVYRSLILSGSRSNTFAVRITFIAANSFNSPAAVKQSAMGQGLVPNNGLTIEGSVRSPFPFGAAHPRPASPWRSTRRRILLASLPACVSVPKS